MWLGLMRMVEEGDIRRSATHVPPYAALYSIFALEYKTFNKQLEAGASY